MYMASIINRVGGGVNVKNNDELIGNGGRSDTGICREKRRRLRRRRDVMPYNIIYSSSMAGTAVRGRSKTAKEVGMNRTSGMRGRKGGEREGERTSGTEVGIKSTVNRRRIHPRKTTGTEARRFSDIRHLRPVVELCHSHGQDRPFCK